MYSIGQEVRCINNAPLKGNEIAPSLIVGEKYTVKQIIFDSAGNQHLDVGIVSEVEYVRSYETKEQLRNGHLYHWCHPSRFESI